MSTEHDIRWKQRFSNLQLAYRRLQQAIEANRLTPGNDLIQMALIKAFEMSFELAWKTLKDYLNYNGIDVKLPREVIKQAFANELVSDGQLWIDMLEERNLMAHIYDQARALKAVNHICQRYILGLDEVHGFLSAKLA